MYLQATTACLAAIVVAQVFNLFLCRHPRRSFLRTGALGNPLLLLGVAAELGIIALIVYTPLGNSLFGTAALGGEIWLFALVLAAAMGVLEEARKLLVRRGIVRRRARKGTGEPGFPRTPSASSGERGFPRH